MSAGKGFSEGLAKLLATPSLMNGEDATVYAELYARVEEVAQPEDIWDQMMVSDVVNHFWEQQRYRRCTGTIINANRHAALEKILLTATGLSPPDAKRAADAYLDIDRYSSFDNPDGIRDIPRTRDSLMAFLNKRGISEADIDRVALEMSLNTLFGLERLALKHELRREAILQELEHRRERRAGQEGSRAAAQRRGRGRVLAEPSQIELPAAHPPDHLRRLLRRPNSPRCPPCRRCRGRLRSSRHRRRKFDRGASQWRPKDRSRPTAGTPRRAPDRPPPRASAARAAMPCATAYRDLPHRNRQLPPT
jgi:hypothetical protein